MVEQATAAPGERRNVRLPNGLRQKVTETLEPEYEVESIVFDGTFLRIVASRSDG